MSRRTNKVMVATVFVVAFSSFAPVSSGADFSATQQADISITFDIPDDQTSVAEPVVDEPEVQVLQDPVEDEVEFIPDLVTSTPEVFIDSPVETPIPTQEEPIPPVEVPIPAPQETPAVPEPEGLTNEEVSL